MLFFIFIILFINFTYAGDQNQTDITSQSGSAYENMLLLSNVNQYNLESSQKELLKNVRTIVDKEIGSALKKEKVTEGPKKEVPVKVTKIAEKKEEVCKTKELCQEVDIQIKEATTSNILLLLSKISGLTILLSSKNDPIIRNLFMQKTTIEQILEHICDQASPRLEIISAGNKIKLIEKGALVEAKKDEYLTETMTLKIATITIDLKKNIENIWQAITQKNINCVINLDAETRKLTVRGTADHIKDFKKFLESIDAPRNQVKLDMVLVLANSNFVQEVGINWSGIYNRLSSLKSSGKNFGFVGLGGRLTDFPTPTQPISSSDGNLYVNPTNLAANLFNSFTDLISCGSSIVSQCFSTLPIVFGGPDLNTRRLNIILNAAEQESIVRIKSKPTVVVSNNQIVKILVGTSLPIYTSVQDVVQSNVRTLSQLNYKDIGLAIQILPTISSDRKSVNLDIFVENAEIQSGNTVYNETGIAQNPPVLLVLKLKNQVTLINGQTAMIGGLNTRSSEIQTNRIPFLWRVPFFGKLLFQARAEQSSDEQAFVFITPTIIEGE